MAETTRSSATGVPEHADAPPHVLEHAPGPAFDPPNGSSEPASGRPPLEPPPVLPITEDESRASSARRELSAARDAEEPLEIARVTTSDFDAVLPRPLQTAASWAWRVIIVVVLAFSIGWLLQYLSEVTIPLAVAILLTAMLAPVCNRLHKWGLPRVLATAITVLGGLILIVGALTLIGTQIASQGGSLGTNVVDGFNALTNWLQTGPLKVSESWFQLDEWTTRLQTFLRDSQSTIARYASDVGASVGHFLAGTAITLFSLFFFLLEGRMIVRYLERFVPEKVRDHVDQAGFRGWHALGAYVRATILVALADAVGVLIVAEILRVPLAPALAALVFIGAFVPIVGALVSGFVAVLVALVALGWVQALIMLAGVIAVMQIEGHILQPFLLGRAVRIHPLAVIFAIAIGIIVGGIVGALLAVPILAFVKAFVDHLTTGSQHDVVEPATG